MNFEIIRSTPKNFEFVYSNQQLKNFIPFINCLKRICFSEIPTIAIHHLFNLEDSTIDFDEKVVHRIGLIPLTYPGFQIVSDMNTWPNCPCQKTDMKNENDDEDIKFGCEKCTMRFKILVKCPETEKSKPIRASDIKLVSKHMNIEVWRKDFIKGMELIGDPIISYITRGKTFEMECFATKSKGSDHAKWSPITSMGARRLKNIQLKSDIIEKNWNDRQKEGFIDSCPKKVFNINDKNQVFIEKLFNCNECKECVDFCEIENLPNVVSFKNTEKVHVQLESVGPIPPIDLLKISSLLLTDKCDYYINLFDK